MIWSNDLASDNAHFLERVDAALYYRTAHNIIAEPDTSSAEGAKTVEADEDDQSRKDVSSLSRLLWHHGVETLVMMLGAYMQAPSAAHGYFLKCKTDDAIQIAQLLLREKRPKYHRLTGTPFTLVNLLNGVHRCAGWTDRDLIIGRFARALRNMLGDYAREAHRWEYNSIKHGFRASHGRFAFAIGIQEAPGVPAPAEAMEIIGFSRDASFFDVAKPLRGASMQASKIHFMTEKFSVSWSLEKVLCELQLISILLHNTVSALRIVGGSPAGTVSFNKIADDEAFWEAYADMHASNIPVSSMSIDIDVQAMTLPTDQEIFASYRT